MSANKMISRSISDVGATVTGRVIKSDDEKSWFIGSVFRSGEKKDVTFEIQPDATETVDLIFSNVRIVESFGATGIQKYIIGYGLIQNISLYRIHDNSGSNNLNSSPFSLTRIGVYADDTQNHPNTVFDTSASEPTVMIKVSTAEFDRLLLNFRSNMFCKLSLEGAPIYKVDDDTWATQVGKKNFVDKRTKFEFNPSARCLEIADDQLARNAALISKPSADIDDDDDYNYINPAFRYLPAAKTILLQKLFIIPFALSFLVAYGSLSFIK
jgi:hypothetical protein